MTTIPSSTTPPATTPTSDTANSTAALNQNFDQFLTLLTTQLKNQDPLSPMDSTQFTNQLVSFSQVEQQIKTNDNLTKLQALTANSQTTLGLSYIGLQVIHSGSQFNLYSNSAATMNYTLPSDAATVKLSVLDKDGNLVYSRDGADGEGTKGAHTFTWDGTDNNGDAVPAGTYKFVVGAADTTGKTLTATTVVPAVVTGIQSESDGSTSLILDNTTQTISLSDVTKATL